MAHEDKLFSCKSYVFKENEYAMLQVIWLILSFLIRSYLLGFFAKPKELQILLFFYHLQ